MLHKTHTRERANETKLTTARTTVNHQPPAMTTDPATTPINVPKMRRFARLEMTAGAFLVTTSVTASRGDSADGFGS
jgi:hypothetical protein